MDPVALKILQDLPLPNLAGLTNNFYANGPIALTRHKLDTKGNWNATNKLTFTGRLGWLRYSFANPPAFGDLVGPAVSSAYGKLGPGLRRHLFDHRQRAPTSRVRISSSTATSPAR